MLQKLILLDIDGVLVTAHSWKKTEELADGFSKFNEKAVKNLNKVISETSAAILLTSTHNTKYTSHEWRNIMINRGIIVNEISLISQYVQYGENSRLYQITQWHSAYSINKRYVIIDDDSSLYSLPIEIKRKWVPTKSLVGLDQEGAIKAIEILNNYTLY